MISVDQAPDQDQKTLQRGGSELGGPRAAQVEELQQRLEALLAEAEAAGAEAEAARGAAEAAEAHAQQAQAEVEAVRKEMEWVRAAQVRGCGRGSGRACWARVRARALSVPVPKRGQVRALTPASAHMRVCTHMPTGSCTLRKHAHAHAHTGTHAHRHACAHTGTHAHRHPCAHTHAQTRTRCRSATRARTLRP